MKRIEASLSEWETLYHYATILGEMKPWNTFTDTDFIVLNRIGEEPVFISILGAARQTYGIALYEGYYGLAKLNTLLDEAENELASRYLMLDQMNLTCYWGNSDEPSPQQKQIIKNLGYQYRGKNKWLYFKSLKPGYLPYDCDQAEVKRLIDYYKLLIEAITYYRETEMDILFDGYNGYWYSLDPVTNQWYGYQEDLPEVGESVPYFDITESKQWDAIKNNDQSEMILEIDAIYLGVIDAKDGLDRPTLGHMILIVDADSGLIISATLLEDEQDKYSGLLNLLLDYLVENPIPMGIAVRYSFFVDLLQPLTQALDIKLFKGDYLPACDIAIMSFWKQFER